MASSFYRGDLNNPDYIYNYYNGYHDLIILHIKALMDLSSIRPKKKDSCVQVSEVKKIRVGRSKNIFILDYFFITNVQRL